MTDCVISLICLFEHMQAPKVKLCAFLGEYAQFFINSLNFCRGQKERPDRRHYRKDRFRWRFAFRIFRADTSAAWLQDAIFMIFELLAGDVRQKWKKSHSRWGGVAKVTNRIPTLHGDQKKNASHAAWECRNWFLQHLSNENVGFTKHENFVVVNFGDFGVVKK